jgi:hypothetical protein
MKYCMIGSCSLAVDLDVATLDRLGDRRVLCGAGWLS